MRRVTVIGATVVLLAACGGDGDDAASAEETTTSTTAATTTTTEATTTTTGADGAACLVGTWALDSEDFVGQLADGIAAEAGGEEVTVEFVGGSYTVTMADTGRFTATREEWSFQISTAEGAFRITVDGVDAGEWEAEDGTLTVHDVESASTVTAQAVVDGQLVDLPSGTVPVTDSDAIGTSSAYTCSTDELVVNTGEGFTSRLTRADG